MDNLNDQNILWLSKTNEWTSTQINSADPNEPLENGKRHSEPFPNKLPDDDRYLAIYQKFFSDGPKLKFIASNQFTGSKYGYVFMTGPKGQGYYIDPLIMRHVYYF